MTTSPLQFAQEYDKFQSSINALNVPDRRLLQIVAFWPIIQPVTKKSQYRDYLEEYISLLSENLSAPVLIDMTIEELSNTRAVLLALTVAGSDNLRSELDLVTMQLVTQLFYVGATEQALSLCAELVDDGAKVELDDSIGEELDSFEALGRLIEIHETGKSGIVDLLRELHAKWEIERTGLRNDRIWCLFVEKDRHNRSFRGRMRQLVGKVSPQHGEPDESDTVIFDHQIKTPDDPFIGVAYDSISAVKKLLQRRRGNAQSSAGWLGHFSINESQQAFTGDSIGLAFSLLTYTQLLKTEITRHERYVSTDIAVTGSINRQGVLQAVNRESLVEKVSRAFFSHVSVLLVPLANLSSARHFLDRLIEKYPRRQLHLIGHEKLSSAVQDKNVIQPEKVCIGQFIARKAGKISRETKIQVPLLLGLIYLLVCLMFPKAWAWFDWNPQYLSLTERGFEALNRDSISLWEVEYECPGITSYSVWDIGDLDGDSRNEIAFSPHGLDADPCDTSAVLYVYDDNGDKLFDGSGVFLNHYPGDTVFLDAFNISYIRIVKSDAGSVILTTASEDNPSRTYIRLWSNTGDLLGQYINSGAVGLDPGKFSEFQNRVFVFLGINNRAKRACMFILSKDSFHGVSPPYSDSLLPGLSKVERGDQLCYISFPLTDVDRAMFLLYNNFHSLTVFSDSLTKVAVIVGKSIEDGIIDYSIDNRLRAVAAMPSDEFYSTRDLLVHQGELDSVYYPAYFQDLLHAVSYWTDSGWVTEGELRALEDTL